jgi:hypothetical protein
VSPFVHDTIPTARKTESMPRAAATRALAYDEGHKKATADQTPIVVYVGCEPRAIPGTVAVKVVGSVTSALTDHADTTSVGTATSAAGLIAATAASAMLTAGQAWVDNAPSKFEPFPANWTIISEDIVVASTANITGGTLTLQCWWFPVVAGSGLVAAAV